MQVRLGMSQNSLSLQAGEHACTTHLSPMQSSFALQVTPEPGTEHEGTWQRPFRHAWLPSHNFEPFGSSSASSSQSLSMPSQTSFASGFASLFAGSQSNVPSSCVPLVPHQVHSSPSLSKPSSYLPSQSLSRVSQISVPASFCSSTLSSQSSSTSPVHSSMASLAQSSGWQTPFRQYKPSGQGSIFLPSSSSKIWQWSALCSGLVSSEQPAANPITIRLSASMRCVIATSDTTGTLPWGPG